MTAYRDLCNPSEPHVVTLDRVRLEFGAGGVLATPDAEQVATMTATALRRERFVVVEAPAPAPLPPRAEAAAEVPAGAATTQSAAAAEDVDRAVSRSSRPRRSGDA